jgi:shikimate dehydrogenase
VGLAGDVSPIPAELLPSDLLVLDLIYNPPQTRLLHDAAAAGCSTQNGELMLLHQGAAAFTLWTGQPAPVELMREKLDAELAVTASEAGSAAEPGDPGAG